VRHAHLTSLPLRSVALAVVSRLAADPLVLIRAVVVKVAAEVPVVWPQPLAAAGVVRGLGP
jgi:hypothetical protein